MKQTETKLRRSEIFVATVLASYGKLRRSGIFDRFKEDVAPAELGISFGWFTTNIPLLRSWADSLEPVGLLVGTARCAVRAVHERRSDIIEGWVAMSHLFRPLGRGRGHRSAMSLP